MTIAKAIQPPSWINSNAAITVGLDLLGLRLPVQFIGGSLINGITTVTPSVRYLAFRAWIIQCYGKTGYPDSWQTFADFAARIESALVIGNLAQDPSITGLIGADEALKRLEVNSPQIEISSLVKTPAITIYTGPSDQLNISKTRENSVPALTIERGCPLARAVDQRLSRIPLVKHLLLQNNSTHVSVDDLKELGTFTRIDQIPENEQELLLAALIPCKPLPREHARIGTYASLLALASKLNKRPSETDLFKAACSVERFDEPLLDHVADGWTTYCVRDAIAVSHEAVLAAVMNEIMASDYDGITGVDCDLVIAALMQRVNEHDAALRDLGLLNARESVTAFSFRGLQHRIQDRLSIGSQQMHGINRWTDKLIEPILYKRALTSGAGSLSLAVVAWILADVRVSNDFRERSREYAILSYQGWRRLGMREVILPELERFQREDKPFREVAAALGYRIVQQHLQVAWSRLQVDIRRDVALLTAEGNKWFARGKGFAAGRTASRIQQALSWLTQLNLIDDGGITADGDVVLKRAFKVLSEGVAE